MRILNLTGFKNNNLTALEIVGKTKQGRMLWKCLCDCGKETIVSSSCIKRGTIKSCGCIINKNKITHNMSKTRFYNTYSHIIQRCNNINNKDYKNYGERGIKVCDRWLESFENFRDDMYEKYLEHCKDFGEKDTSIDRIDVDGNYELNNCRWATTEEQNYNQRRHKYD